jgi:sugar phosphate isomerase/epimerase
MTRPVVPSSRREFLTWTGGALAAAVATRPIGARTPQLWAPRVAMQLYCVREELPKDPAATLAALSKMGYQGVELENWHNRTPAEWRKLLDASGLQAAGFHVSFKSVVGEALKKTVEDNAVVGNRFLIVRSLGAAQLQPRENFMRTLDQFNQIAEELEPYGMRIGFHNHAEMFKPMDGTRLWDVMMDHTRADVVLQLDTGNAQGGDPTGVDILQVLRRNPGRVDTMHVKPYSTANPAAFIGDDQLKWADIVAETRKHGIEWYIIEYERPGVPLDNMRANLNGFRKFYSG